MLGFKFSSGLEIELFRIPFLLPKLSSKSISYRMKLGPHIASILYHQLLSKLEYHSTQACRRVANKWRNIFALNLCRSQGIEMLQVKSTCERVPRFYRVTQSRGLKK